ncbi:MAG: histidine phosphatase family protein [Pseudomonadota bacterium]
MNVADGTIIYLVRHGEAAAKWGDNPDPGLSELGARQALAAADILRSMSLPPAHIITSPLRRARETAAPYAMQLGKTPTVDPVFRELPSPVALDQRAQWIQSFMTQRWNEQNEDITRWRSILLQQLTQLTGSVAIFTHFVVINAVVAHVMDCPDTLCVMPANGSVFTFAVTDGVLSHVHSGTQQASVVN